MEKCVPQWLRARLLPGQIAVSSNVDGKMARVVAGHYRYEVVKVNQPDDDDTFYAAVRQLNLLNPEEEAYGAVAFHPYSDIFEVSEKLLELARPRLAPEGLSDRLIEVMPQVMAQCECESAPASVPDNEANLLSRAIRSIIPKRARKPDFDKEEDEEALLARQRKEWEDRLAAMVMEYVAQFHDVPDLTSLEQTVRGKLSLRNTGRFSAVTVSGDLRIYLPDYNEMELRMTPLARTLYIFFLCHPEGVCLADIPDYTDELADIYLLVKPGADEKLARSSIADLTRPFSESLQQKLSLTRRAVRRQILTPSLAEHYLIKGERGGKYGIEIPAELRRLPAVLRQ